MAFDTAKGHRDREAEENGAWMDYDEDTRFLVARITNAKYAGFISRKMKEHESLMNSSINTKQADEVAKDVMLEGCARYLLLDWEGVLDNGKPMEYSPEAAKAVLEEHDDLRIMIEKFAQERANYLAKQEAKDKKELAK